MHGEREQNKAGEREQNKAGAQAAAHVLPGTSSRQLGWLTAAESLAKTINRTTRGTRSQSEKLLVQQGGGNIVLRRIETAVKVTIQPPPTSSSAAQWCHG